jgi:hypothetical protein
VLAWLTQAWAVRRILHFLKLSDVPPPLRPAREPQRQDPLWRGGSLSGELTADTGGLSVVFLQRRDSPPLQGHHRPCPPRAHAG